MDNNQLTHNQQHNRFSSKNIILLCDHVKGPANIGGLFRLADAFGITEIIFAGHFPDMRSNRLKRTSRSAHEKICFRESENTKIDLEVLHQKGYTSIALEITSKSIPLQELNVTNEDKIVLIIGDENHGVSKEVLDAVQYSVHIPMFGTNSSMNVAQAAGIAFYELTRS